MSEQPIVLGELPDDILAFKGTAEQLAETCNALLPRIGLATDAGAANERLVRHYVSVGVLSPPERAGREALFDQRHIREFLAARYLLNDGWSLAKIAELIRSLGPEGLTRIAPGPRTAAEETITRLRMQQQVKPGPSHRAPQRVAAMSVSEPPAITETLSLDPLAQAAEISTRRQVLRTSLAGLGNLAGEPARRRTLQITLTPWCQVFVDASELSRMPADTPEVLGHALTQALHEERIRKGDKP